MAGFPREKRRGETLATSPKPQPPPSKPAYVYTYRHCCKQASMNLSGIPLNSIADKRMPARHSRHEKCKNAFAALARRGGPVSRAGGGRRVKGVPCRSIATGTQNFEWARISLPRAPLADATGLRTGRGRGRGVPCEGIQDGEASSVVGTQWRPGQISGFPIPSRCAR